MQYIDDFLPEVLLERLQRTLDYIDWYVTATAYGDDKPSLSHLIDPERYNDCSFKELSLIVASFIGKEIGRKPEDIIRIRYGLIFKISEESVKHMSHVDYPASIPNISTTLYLNDNNGYLYTYDGDKEVDKLKPKTNRLVILEGDVEHGTSTPTDAETRLAVTVNFRSE